MRNAEGKEADPAHPAFRLVHDEANDWTSAAELRIQLICDALLHDEGGFARAYGRGASARCCAAVHSVQILSSRGSPKRASEHTIRP